MSIVVTVVAGDIYVFLFRMSATDRIEILFEAENLIKVISIVHWGVRRAFPFYRVERLPLSQPSNSIIRFNKTRRWIPYYIQLLSDIESFNENLNSLDTQFIQNDTSLMKFYT